LLEIEQALKSLNGVVMEIIDCAYPLIKRVIPTSNPQQAFQDCDYSLLVGGFPRTKNMTRKDLLQKNGEIFKSMGEGLEKYAKKTCKILVIANPANTNCLICSKYAPKIPKKKFFCFNKT